MMRRKVSRIGTRGIALAATAIVTGLVLSACSGGSVPASTPASSASAKIKDGGTLTIGLAGTSIGSVDPSLSQTLVSSSILSTLCEPLYRESVDGKLQPALAASAPKFNSDSSSATVTLRDGLKFTDGTPIDAAAVKFTYDRNKTMKGSQRAGDLSSVTAMTVVDPKTVKIDFAGPTTPAAFSDVFTGRSGYPVSPTAVQKMGDAFGTAPVCAGGFVLKTQTTDTVRIERDPGKNFYDEKSLHLDAIEFKVVADPSVRFTNLQSGQFNVIQQLSPKDIAALKGNSDLSLISYPGRGFVNLSMNTKTLSDPLVRRALVESIDRKVISDTVYASLFPPTCSFMNEKSPLSSPEAQACITYDPKAAKADLKKAGAKTPVPVVLEFSSSTEFSQIATLVQAMGKETGFDIQLKPTDTTTNTADTKAGKNDLSIGQWTGVADPAGNIQLDPGAFLNQRGYDNPKMNALVDQLRKTADPTKQKALYGQVQTLINEDLPLMYLVRTAVIHGAGKSVAGVQYGPTGGIYAMRAGLTS
ncbi:ABC transporter substrate-binding protein [Microbacterium sp. ASV81]|uniref:ABC transporter substrate-binding protein n=1 Tax=Microbacterium capsulatum TaxID=3041921 RepID=A0ABU0XJC2_9MICO|nr:ABC transporter substrate-binding protein [Microbacterium sp. ASV81]MDQ4214698.1 ABC transporter substrate-binding protein [Microbacterium sp. ASV81]